MLLDILLFLQIIILIKYAPFLLLIVAPYKVSSRPIICGLFFFNNLPNPGIMRVEALAITLPHEPAYVTTRMKCDKQENA